VRRPGVADAAGIALLTVLFVLPMAANARRRHELADPRRLAVDWLAANARPNDTVLIVREIAILEDEVARVPGRALSSSWDDAPAAIRNEAPRLVVAGVLMRLDHSLDAASAWPALAGYHVVFQEGLTPTAPFPNWWRGNGQIVVVFERNASG
jgi:hypothetical protein